MDEPTILVTNDDGIDSVGLIRLARALTALGRVVIVAPDREFSGSGASIGPLHLVEPEVVAREVDGVDAAWTVDGPPALCVIYARMGAFGPTPDVIVSGVNPGANLGYAVYHSGTVGAVLTGRNGGIPGVAISQKFAEPGPESGDPLVDYNDRVARQEWDSAVTVAVAVTAGVLAQSAPAAATSAAAPAAAAPPPEPIVVNVNVPNRPLAEISGWNWATVANRPPGAMTEARLVPRTDRPTGRYRVEVTRSDEVDLQPDSDAKVVDKGLVAISVLSRLTHLPIEPAPIGARLDGLVPNDGAPAQPW